MSDLPDRAADLEFNTLPTPIGDNRVDRTAGIAQAVPGLFRLWRHTHTEIVARQDHFDSADSWRAIPANGGKHPREVRIEAELPRSSRARFNDWLGKDRLNAMTHLT
jgi:hypothetical protein